MVLTIFCTAQLKLCPIQGALAIVCQVMPVSGLEWNLLIRGWGYFWMPPCKGYVVDLISMCSSYSYVGFTVS